MSLHEYQDLPNGTLFEYDGKYYIKSIPVFLCDAISWNAVELLTGERAWFNEHNKHTRVVGAVIVRDSEIIEV